MSEKLTVCKKCNSRKLKTIIVLNPNTLDMNMKALIRCNECGKFGFYDVSSNHYKEQRRRGFIR